MRFFIFLIFACLAWGSELRFDSAVLKGELENGLKYYILANDNPKNMAYFYLDINSGSTDENATEQGLAHFVEHMAFNGSKNFSKNELIKKLESLGVRFGADLNAMTSFLNTTYNLQISVNEQNVNSAFLVLEDWLGGLNFDFSEIQKEKGVILEEAKKDYQRRIYEQRAKYLYGDSIFINRFPIGKNEIIKNATKDDLVGFYKKNYQPKFSSIIVVGDIDPKSIQKQIKSRFAKFKNNEFNHENKKLSDFQTGFFEIVEKQNKANMANLIFEDDFSPLNNEENLRKIWLKQYISRLLNLSYEKLNITLKSPLNGSFSSDSLFNQRTLNIFSINIISNDAKTSLESLFSAIKGVNEFGFCKSDFESVKKELTKANLDEFSTTSTAQKDLREILSFVYNGSVKMSKRDKFEIVSKMLNTITLDEVNEYFKQITSKKMLTELILQKSSNLTHQKVMQIYQNAKAYDFSKDLIVPKTFLSQELKKQEFATEVYDKNNSIHIISLKNGSKVILKDIKTIKNQILFSAQRVGGYSNLDDPNQAKMAVALLNAGTVGKFSRYESTKIKKGSNYSLRHFIGDISTGSQGRSSVGDFEKLLIEYFVKFNEPILDESAFVAYKTRAISDLEKANQTSEYRFQKELLKRFYNNSKRAKPLEINDIKKANLKDLQKIADFAFSGEFVFVISGDLEISKIKDLVAVYLANLPNSNEKITIKDDKLRAILGEHLFEANYAQSDKAEVSVILQNDNIKFDEQNRFKFNAFSDILKRMIMDEIREEKSQIYSISLTPQYAKFPHENASLELEFSCEKKIAKEVAKNIKNIIQKIAKNGVKDDYLSNFKATHALSQKTKEQKADFWLGVLNSHFVFDMPLYTPQNRLSEIQKLNSDDMKNMASMILDGNFFVAILQPKD